jgi:glycosyltransferase involved in cell wall biosynthesis
VRVAVFAPYLPAPATTGGRIRIHRLAQALADVAELELFAVADPNELEKETARSALEPYAARHVAAARFTSLPALRRAARVRNAAPPALAAAFRRAHASRSFDVLVAEHCHAAAIALEAPGVPLVVDEHNVESEYVAERDRARGPLGYWKRREVALLEGWEQRIWRTAREVVCVSQADAERVGKVRERAPVLIPNGVDMSSVPFRLPSARVGFDVLFVGLMSHPPNVAAARFLADEVMPLVLREEPRARLVLCGMNPNREVLALAREGVEVTGFVDSVAPYLEGAAVYANPLRFGAGTSLKVLEALASGLPLVSTAVGVRGFGLRAGPDYSEAESGQGFAREILDAFRNRGRFDDAATRGRELAAAYDWSALCARFADLVRGLAHRA